MRKYVLTLAVLAAVPLLLAMPGNAQQANSVVAAGAVPLSDEEMDNVSAAGLGDWFADLFGESGKSAAPGQKLKSGQVAIQSEGGRGARQYARGQQLKQLRLDTACTGPGKSCSAPGHLMLNAQTLGKGRSGTAPGRL
jgi:hypothetical protein